MYKYFPIYVCRVSQGLFIIKAFLLKMLFFRLLLYLCCWRPVKTTSIHQQVMLKTPQHPKHNPNCFPTRFHVLIVYHGHPNGMKLKQGDGSFSLCLKLYCSRSLHWGWWRDYSWLSWPGRSAEKLRNAQVVLRFELTLHGWITLTEYTYYHKSVIFCSIILALLFLLHTYAGFPPVELFRHFLIQQRQSRSSL